MSRASQTGREAEPDKQEKDDETASLAIMKHNITSGLL
jgi:hypothetical protein